MEIAKEKFIETFKKECEKAIEEAKPESFRASGGDEEPAIEIVANDKVSFYISKTINNYEQKTYSFTGKILFRGFVDYKSIEISEEEFESLFEFFAKSESLSRLELKNKIVSEGENILEQLIQYNDLK